MITLIPEPNTKWKSKKNGRIFPGKLILGNLDSPANYELVDISEYEAQVKAEEEARKKAKEEALKEAKEEGLKAKEEMKQAKPQSMLRQINGGKKSW